MTNKKQSSVEWLYNELFNCELTIENWEKALEQAKAMHKEEILSFDALLDQHEMDALNNNTILLTREEFYNETFNNEGL